VVESTPTINHTPTKLRFSTNGGTGAAVRAELTSIGVLKVSGMTSLNLDDDLQIVNNGTGRLRLPAGTTVDGVPIGAIAIAGSVANSAALPSAPIPAAGTAYVVEDPAPAHLWASNGTAWVDLGAFQGPAGADGQAGVGIPIGGETLQVLAKSSANDYETQWVNAFSGSYDDLTEKPISITSFGITDGTAGQVLTTDGNGLFTFTTVGGSTVGTLDDLSDVTLSGLTTGQVLKYNGSTWVNDTDNSSTLFSRSTLTDSTSSLANGGTGPINITGFKSYALLKIQTSAAAWVRIYTNEASRLADASRLEGEDPLPGAGVIAEVITTGAETVIVSPATIGFNDESPVTNIIPVRVTNKSGGDTAITVTLTAIQLEA
jgi:hypothetical protein